MAKNRFWDAKDFWMFSIEGNKGEVYTPNTHLPQKGRELEQRHSNFRCVIGGTIINEMDAPAADGSGVTRRVHAHAWNNINYFRELDPNPFKGTPSWPGYTGTSIKWMFQDDAMSLCVLANPKTMRDVECVWDFAQLQKGEYIRLKHPGKRVWVFALHGKVKILNRGRYKDSDVIDSINFITISGNKDYDIQGRSSDNMVCVVSEL